MQMSCQRWMYLLRFHLPVEVELELAFSEHQYLVVCRVQPQHMVYLDRPQLSAISWNRLGLTFIHFILVQCRRSSQCHIVIYKIQLWLLSKLQRLSELDIFCTFKARFAHLCTVMSRMHHRRQGYPFGSLVDFAADSMGRKSIRFRQFLPVN